MTYRVGRARIACTARKNGGPSGAAVLALAMRPKIKSAETISFRLATTGLAPVRALSSPTWARRAADARERLHTRRRREHGHSRAWS